MAASLAVLIVGGCCQHMTSIPPATQPSALTKLPSSSHHFLVIPGKIAGGGGIVYIVDEDRHLMSALTYDDHAGRMIHMMSSIALDRVFSPANRRQYSSGEARIAGAISGNEYTAIAGQSAGGNDVLYLTDHVGLIAVFAYDPAARSVLLRAIGSAMDAFK
jgi:hypothetical protein